MSRAAVRPLVDPLTLTRQQRRDRDAVIAGFHGGQIKFGWEPGVLALYDVPVAALEAACVAVEALGENLDLKQQDPAAVIRFARKLGAPRPELVLRLIDAVGDIDISNRGKVGDILWMMKR